MTHVLLVGFMGSGKSSVGQLLAEERGVPFIDLDERIEAGAGHSVREIFATEGEEGFRDREARALAALKGEPSSVVACGGGIVVRQENRELLGRLGTVVYLRVSARTLPGRIGANNGRPLLHGRSEADIAALLAAREPLYEEAADIVVDTDGRSVTEVCEAVQSALDRKEHA